MVKPNLGQLTGQSNPMFDKYNLHRKNLSRMGYPLGEPFFSVFGAFRPLFSVCGHGVGQADISVANKPRSARNASPTSAFLRPASHLH